MLFKNHSELLKISKQYSAMKQPFLLHLHLKECNTKIVFHMVCVYISFFAINLPLRIQRTPKTTIMEKINNNNNNNQKK